MCLGDQWNVYIMWSLMVYSGFCCCFPLGYWGKEGCRLSDIIQCPSNGRNKAARGLWALLLVGRGSLGGEHTARLLPQGRAFASLWEEAAPVSYSIHLLVSFCYFIATLLGVKFFCLKIPSSLVFGKHLYSQLDIFHTKDIQRPSEKVYSENWA